MASSGTIWGAQSGTRPRLKIEWAITQTDIANNRWYVRLRMYLVSNYRISFSANKTGKLQGSSFTYTGGASGTGEWLVSSRSIWVYANSDGTKTQNFNGSLNINITWSGSRLSTLSVSGNATLDRIPRASSITRFNNFSVKDNTETTLEIGINRVSSSFSHDITLRVNGENIQSWNGQGTPSTLKLSSSNANRILNIMRNTTSMTAQLRVQTKSGNTNIGSVLTRNATVTVHSDVKPSISDISISDAVTDIANNLGVYVQGRSKLKTALSTTPGYGARDGSFKITVDGQTFTNKSFTTSEIRNSGNLTISIEYTNTRGQKTTASEQITVYAYQPPTISRLTAERIEEQTPEEIEGNVTKALINIQASISPLNNKNQNEFIIRYRPAGQSDWEQTQTINDSGYSINEVVELRNINTDLAYDVEVIASDYFRSSSLIRSLPPAFTLMNFHESGEAIAFGGVAQRERGMEVYLPAHFENEVYFKQYPTTRISENTDLNNLTIPGMYFESTNARASTMANLPVQRAFSLFVERHAGIKQTFTQYDGDSPRTWVRNYYSGSWGSWKEIQFI